MMPFDLTGQDGAVRFVYLGIILIALIASVSALHRHNILGALRNLAIWIGLFAVALMAYAHRFDLEAAGYRVFGMLVPGVPVPGPTAGSVIVAKSRDGHFHVRATIHGHALQMIVDTGASAVVLTDRDALAIGIRPREDAYTVSTSTANGHASTAPVILPDLTIGGISQRNVPALIAQPGTLDSSLLGNSFLERLKSFTFEGDRLMLRR
jgi:aspartyl protease family protein